MMVGFFLSACGAGPLANRGMNFAALNSDLRLPVQSLQERRFASVVRQAYDFSCGSAALATLLTYHYGDPQDEATVFRGMWAHGDRAQIRRLGFSLLDMKRYLQDRGMNGDGYRIPIAKIAAAQVPGIALIDVKGYRHFVIVKGLSGGSVLIGDPSLGIRVMATAEFEKIWNGVYFVVTDGSEGKSPAFNARGDWSLISTGRYSVAAEPLSLQALALMRPQTGEF